MRIEICYNGFERQLETFWNQWNSFLKEIAKNLFEKLKKHRREIMRRKKGKKLSFFLEILAIFSALLVLKPVETAAVTLPSSINCTTDANCMNGGFCRNNACVCADGWQGSDCQFCGGKVRWVIEFYTTFVASTTGIWKEIQLFLQNLSWNRFQVYQIRSHMETVLSKNLDNYRSRINL